MTARRNHILQQKIQGITTLPTLPQIASRLMRMVSDPEASASAVAELIQQDPSIAARVLRLANSVFYGIPRHVTSLSNAVVILGFRVVSTVVVTITVFDLFPQDRDSKTFDREAFWRHCFGVGIIARMLAARLHKKVAFDPDEAFCAGLLHDIGKVIMEQYLHDDFHAALALSQEREIPFFEAEKRLLGYAHTDVAEWLTSQWELPLVLREPMMLHHQPSHATEYRDIICMCHYADWLWYEAGMGGDVVAPSPLVDDACLHKKDIADMGTEWVKTNVPEELKKINLLLGSD
jgi:HD-like signal output (HDOD) protein